MAAGAAPLITSALAAECLQFCPSPVPCSGVGFMGVALAAFSLSLVAGACCCGGSLVWLAASFGLLRRCPIASAGRSAPPTTPRQRGAGPLEGYRVD